MGGGGDFKKYPDLLDMFFLRSHNVEETAELWFCVGLMLLMLLLAIFQVMFLWIGKNCGQSFISQVLGVPNYGSIPQNMVCACLAVHQ